MARYLQNTQDAESWVVRERREKHHDDVARYLDGRPPAETSYKLQRLSHGPSGRQDGVLLQMKTPIAVIDGPAAAR